MALLQTPGLPSCCSSTCVLPPAACRRDLSCVSQRWRFLCFNAQELWEAVSLEAPRFEMVPGRRQRWLEGKLWLLQVRRVKWSVGSMHLGMQLGVLLPPWLVREQSQPLVAYPCSAACG